LENRLPSQYGAVTKLLHWTMAILVIWQFLKFFDRIDDGEHWVGQTLVSWHISIGTLALLLIVLRTCWTLTHRQQRPAHEQKMAFLVDAGHFLLYLSLFLLPVTGILRMVGGGYGVKAFGWQLIEKGNEVSWAASLGSLHSPFAWTLLILVAGHIMMSLYHQFVRRDGVFARIV